MEAVLSAQEVIRKANSVIEREFALPNPDMKEAYEYAYNLLKHHLKNTQNSKKAGKS